MTAARLPHRAPMLLIADVSESLRERVVCRGWIPADYPLAAAGRVPSVVAVELGAQASALLEVSGEMAEERGGQPRIGLLVALRSAAFHVPWLPTETPLRVEALRVGGAASLSMIDCVVAIEGSPEMRLAEAQLSTFLTERSAGSL